jgi:hypothetical protein
MNARVPALLFFVLTPAVGLTAVAVEAPSPLPATPPAADTLTAFPSEEAFAEFLRTYAPEPLGLRREAVAELAIAPTGFAAPSGAADAESVTNVQHAGVDEGGIVKVHGDHLVILRRGRLFTVAIGDGQLRPVSAVDAFGPEVDPRGTWYDELIVHGDVVAVVGYSYARGGTEVGLFRIDGHGQLRHRSTYQLRSNDYYSSRNYASRLVGSRLVFYAPVAFPVYGHDPVEGLPALRRWQGSREEGEFRRILPAQRVYHAGLPPRPGSFVLHTVTTCDLARRELSCDASAVVGPHGRVFYVSPGAVYIWTSGWWRPGWAGPSEAAQSQAMLYRMPLDGSAPSALRVAGSPVDQFSFLEDDDGHVNVLVRSQGGGDGMWRAEVARGDLALLRVPLGAFSDGSRAAPSSSYRSLPRPEGRTFRNRFVGAHLLYGTGRGWWDRDAPNHGGVYVVPLEGGGFTWLPLEHGVDRIEVLGRDAMVVGSGGEDLHFTSLRLERGPFVIDRHVVAGVAQGELRSHGFFYRPDDGRSGVLGLPVRSAGRRGGAHLVEGSAGIVFLRNGDGRLRPLGRLDASPSTRRDDACRASCVDWYGNARPLFLRGRVFALLGYELVEGSVERDRVHERHRVNFAPVFVAGPDGP